VCCFAWVRMCALCEPQTDVRFRGYVCVCVFVHCAMLKQKLAHEPIAHAMAQYLPTMRGPGAHDGGRMPRPQNRHGVWRNNHSGMDRRYTKKSTNVCGWVYDACGKKGHTSSSITTPAATKSQLAQCEYLQPNTLFCRLTSAPPSTKMRRHASRPFLAAEYAGVQPFCRTTNTNATAADGPTQTTTHTHTHIHTYTQASSSSPTHTPTLLIAIPQH
jgi:hypothetical protein